MDRNLYQTVVNQIWDFRDKADKHVYPFNYKAPLQLWRVCLREQLHRQSDVLYFEIQKELKRME